MGFVAHGVSTILRHLTECTTTSLERVHISWPKIVTQQSPGIPYGWDTFTAPFSMKLSYRPLSRSALNSHTESLFTLVWHFTFSEIINSVVIPCPFTYFDKHCFVQRKDSYKQMYGVILKAFFFFNWPLLYLSSDCLCVLRLDFLSLFLWMAGSQQSFL